MSSILELTLPVAEPVLTSDIVQFLKLPSSNPDIATIVPKLMKAARRQIERWTGLTLAQRSFVQYQDGFPFFPYFQSPYAPLFGAAFPFYFGYGPIASYPYPAIGGLQNQMLDPFQVVALRNPITSITSIVYIGTDGLKHALVPFRDFIPDFATGRVLPLPGQRWPVSIIGANSVQIFFTAGYAPDGTTTPATQESKAGWEPSNSVSQYAYFTDPNGNVQMQTVGPSGTTGSGSAPVFSQSPGGVTPDGSASWTCLGPVLGEYDPQTEYAEYDTVFDGNGNLQTLIVPSLLTGTAPPTWATTLGAMTTDNGVANAWRCLGFYQGVLPNPPDQPGSYSRTINCPEDLQVAIMLLVSHYYYNREPVAAGSAASIPLSLQTIIESVRDLGFTVIPQA
jgi:hypothetical protein